MKEAIGYLQSCYRARAFRIYVVNAPSTINTLWMAAKVALDQNTIDKVNITNESHHPKMDEHINSENLEQKFGGKVPNIEGDCW